jgi:hypothetical protein
MTSEPCDFLFVTICLCGFPPDSFDFSFAAALTPADAVSLLLLEVERMHGKGGSGDDEHRV